jgi:hypothetical protein
MCASRAIHHLIHKNSSAGPEELDKVVAHSLPSLLWALSTDRHLGWTSNWEQREARGEGLSIVPEDGLLALLQPRDKIVAPNKYTASIAGLPLMSKQNFCPHPMIENGPVAKAASCAGDPWIQYSNPADNQAARDYFEMMGYKLADGSFNLGAVVLTMGRRLVAEAVLPALRT